VYVGSRFFDLGRQVAEVRAAFQEVFIPVKLTCYIDNTGGSSSSSLINGCA
jgi:hypothetical protein